MNTRILRCLPDIRVRNRLAAVLAWVVVVLAHPCLVPAVRAGHLDIRHYSTSPCWHACLVGAGTPPKVSQWITCSLRSATSARRCTSSICSFSVLPRYLVGVCALSHKEHWCERVPRLPPLRGPFQGRGFATTRTSRPREYSRRHSLCICVSGTVVRSNRTSHFALLFGSESLAEY